MLGCEKVSVDVTISQLSLLHVDQLRKHTFILLLVLKIMSCPSAGVLKICEVEYLHLPLIVLDQRTRPKDNQSPRLNPLPNTSS